jgi:hypothetical protein
MDNTKRFGLELMNAIDDVDIEALFRYLDALVVKNKSQPSREKYSKYFIAMDIVRMFGGVPNMTKDHLKMMVEYMEQLLKQAFADGVPSELPDYPGLDRVIGEGGKGVNILHLIALYTQSNPDLAHGFISAVRNAGLFSKEIIKSAIKANGAVPLHIAAEANNRPVVELLIRRDDSQLEILNEEGLSASEVAESAGNSSMSAFISEQEAAYRRKIQLRDSANFVIQEKEGLFGRKDTVAGAVLPVQSVAQPNPSGADNMMNFLRTQLMESSVSEMSSSGDTSAVSSTPSSGLEDTLMTSADADSELRMALLTSMLRPDQPDDPRKAAADRENEIQRLGSFIESICDPKIVPCGDVFWTVYWEFVARMGITRLDKFLTAFKKDPSFAARFPGFFHDRINDLLVTSE